MNMKRIIMLDSVNCGAGDTKVGKIYEVIEDTLFMINENKESVEFDYNEENANKYPNATRWITIIDENSEDCFEVESPEKRFIIFENDKELAYELIDRIEGLDGAIINMALMFMK